MAGLWTSHFPGFNIVALSFVFPRLFKQCQFQWRPSKQTEQMPSHTTSTSVLRWNQSLKQSWKGQDSDERESERESKQEIECVLCNLSGWRWADGRQTVALCVYACVWECVWLGTRRSGAVGAAPGRAGLLARPFISETLGRSGSALRQKGKER